MARGTRASPSSTSFALWASTRSKGSPVSAATAESWAECLRLAAAASRLREETGYRWRFAFEQGRLDAAVAAAAEALGSELASAATAEGAALEWREAAAYAGRARGERQRPSHGWAALDTDRGPGRHPRRRWPHEPTDRRATSDGSRHGEDAPRPRLHEDGPPLTDRARRRVREASPAPGGLTASTLGPEAPGSHMVAGGVSVLPALIR